MRLWACLLLLPTLLRADLSNHRCGEPGAELTRHGHIGQPENDYIEITCHNAGEERYLHCARNNQWRLTNNEECPVPTCAFDKLPEQSNHTQRSQTGNQLHDTVTFSCKTPLEGRPILFRCEKKTTKKGLIRFHWKPRTRTAENKKIKTLNCAAPAEPSCQYHEAPHRVVEDDYLTHGLHHIVEDDELTLGCEAGYRLTGDADVYCDVGGVWDPPLPQCEVLRCELPEGQHLTARLDGTDTVLPPGTNLTHNQQAAWGCEQGYTLSTAAIRICDTDWHKKAKPSCRAVRCPVIGPPEHGSRVLYESRTLGGSRRVGSSVVAECNDGYTLLGTHTRFCTSAGSWSGTLQICDNGRSTCKSPGTPIGGMKRGHSYNKGDKVTFSCDTGHTLLGSTERQCLDNGEWTGEETRCIAANEYMTKEEGEMKLGNGLSKLSEKSTDTKLQKDKLYGLIGKEVMLGKNIMQDLNLNGRSTIQELRDNGGLDVYFVLDTSGSIPQDAKETSVEIIKQLVQLVGVSSAKSGTGFGFLAFDSVVWKTVAVAEKTETNEILEFLDEFKARMIRRPTGGTAPSTAFKELKNLITTRIFTPQTSMANRASAIIFLSDGIKNEGGDPIKIRNELVNQTKLHDHEIHVYCIGVGNINLPLLKALATEGSDYLVFLRDLSELKEVVAELYSGNTSYGQCGVQGHQELYTGNVSDVYAKAGTWRWTGGLYLYEGSNPPPEMINQLGGSKFTCGVSLVSKGPDRTQSDWALTAAHCIINGQEDKLLVKFGSRNSSKYDEKGTLVRVKRVIRHEDYDGPTMLHDIALLQLKEQIPFAYDVRPVCLHTPADDYIKVNDKAKMTGWGWWSEKNHTVPHNLKQLTVRVQSNESCEQSTRDMKKAKFHYPNNFCAGNVTVDGTLLDACKKDSGSPLVVCKNNDDLKRICTQIGIVSAGDGCGQAGKYGVYTNVTTYIDWLNSKMNQP